MRVETSDDDGLFEKTRLWLGEHNERFVAWDREPVRLVAYDDGGEVAGSLQGQMYWSKLRVDNLVVRADQRRRGVGAALMARAEEVARERGCSGVYLDTMSFQARGFYERLGYVEYGVLGGFAGDAARHYFHKPLDTSASCDGPV